MSSESIDLGDAITTRPIRLTASHYLRCLEGIVRR